MTIEGEVLTVVESSSDCNISQVGKYRITVKDADTYHLTLIEDPCTWRATTGSAPLASATLYRTQVLVDAGTYTKRIDRAAVTNDTLLGLAGEWELKLDGIIGKGKFALRHDGAVVDTGDYLTVDKEFILSAAQLCRSSGEAIGTFKVVVEGDTVRFFKTEADCAALIFVLRTGPWVKQ